MSSIDIVSNGLTLIRNAQGAKKKSVTMPSNVLMTSIVKILKDKGYIEDFRKKDDDKKNMVEVDLRYDQKGQPVISKIGRISKNSRRVYKKGNDIPRIANGYATVIMSTSSGVITGREAREKNIGGEAVCYIL